jgi:hypothetical protein
MTNCSMEWSAATVEPVEICNAFRRLSVSDYIGYTVDNQNVIFPDSMSKLCRLGAMVCHGGKLQNAGNHYLGNRTGGTGHHLAPSD